MTLKQKESLSGGYNQLTQNALKYNQQRLDINYFSSLCTPKFDGLVFVFRDALVQSYSEDKIYDMPGREGTLD